MTDSDGYVGTWELVPELSIYEWGPRPVSCTYVIAPSTLGIQVEMRYVVEAGGPEQVVVYGGPVDGSRQPLSGAPADGPDGFALTRIDTRTLDSTAMRGAEVVAYGRRVASNDGQLLAIAWEARRPDGDRFRNFQVYRRTTG